MRTKVTSEGLVIPPALLDGWEEVEIHRQNGFVFITPAVAEEPSADEDTYPIIADDDPIYNFGKNPIDIGLTDAAANHDRYLYP